jgi:hypothetical protein
VQGRSSGWVLRRKGGLRPPVCGGMPQFGGMHVPHPLGGHYSSWVSRQYNRAPLVFVFGGRVLVVSMGEVLHAQR